ncbi:MAG TPA: NAD-dependent epimerase/dehydratase family protein [Acidimicrobiales bacterium]|nr:NAD-dependent epimerase/dehydratase family protein [Acidimicrobiales bacterium]
MTILVTGCTARVGSRLIPHLVDWGVECRTLVRDSNEVPRWVTAVERDLLDPESLTRAVEGGSAIVHHSALLGTPDADAIWKLNLEGDDRVVGP